MFLARSACRSLSNLFAATTVAPARAPSALRRPGSNHSNRTSNHTVRWANTVEVKEIDLVKCEQCAKGHHHCKCLRRKYRYNGRMNVTFVTFASQIASESTSPSMVDRIVDYFTAEAPPASAVAAAVLSGDSGGGSSSSVRGSKRTRYSRCATNEVEKIGNKAEEPVVEFDAVAEPFLDHHDEDEAAEAVVAAPKNVRMLKGLESTLDGIYWNTGIANRRTRRKPDRYTHDY